MAEADAKITIGADATAAKSELDLLAQTAQKKLADIGQAFMGVKALLAGGGALGGAFQAVTAPAAELENTAAKLGVVLGDAAAADRLTGSLQHLATNGVVGMRDLSEAARTLSTVMSDDRAISHYVKVFADISAASGLTVQQLAGMVAKTEDAAGGSARLNTLTAAGVPITEALAAAMGKSTQEIAELQKEGKITGSDILAAFEQMTAAGGKFADMNAKMSNTTKGSWDTLTASITECMAEIGKPINDALRPMLQDLSQWVQQNKGGLEAVGNTIATLTTSVHTLTIAMGIWAAKMSGPIIASCKGVVAKGIVPLMAQLGTFRISALATATFWQGVWTSMTTATKAACIAIKGALISTGVGAAVWALGEGVAWLYQKFADTGDAAGSMKEAADAAEDGAEAARRLMQEQEDAAKWEQEHTKQLEEQARLAKEAAEAEERRLKTVKDMVTARKDKGFERHVDDVRGGLGGEDAAVKERLQRVGSPSEEALYAEREQLEQSREMTEEQLQRYKAVCAAIEKIEEEHRKAADAVRAQKEEVKRMEQAYQDRRRSYEESKRDEAYRDKSIGGQEKQLQRDAQAAGYWGAITPEAIRAELDRLAAADAKGNAQRIAELERVLKLNDELLERKRRYNELQNGDVQNLRVQQLQLQGRGNEAAALQQELEMQKRIAELRERGASKKEATRQAEVEMKVKVATDLQDKLNNMRVDFVKSSRGSVGGGDNIRIAQDSKELQRKANEYLRSIQDGISKLGTTGAAPSGSSPQVLA